MKTRVNNILALAFLFLRGHLVDDLLLVLGLLGGKHSSLLDGELVLLISLLLG